MAKNPVSSELLLPPATLNWPHLFVPKKMDEKSDPKYSMVAIWSKADMDKLKPAKEECARLLQEKYGEGWLEMVKAQMLHWPFKNIIGALVKPGYPEGGCFVSFNCAVTARPMLFDRYKDPLTGKAKIVDDPAYFYSGCLVVPLVRPFIFDKGVKKGCSLGLQAVQWWADGPRLDGRTNPIDKFAAEEAPVAEIPMAQDTASVDAMLGTGGVELP